MRGGIGLQIAIGVVISFTYILFHPVFKTVCHWGIVTCYGSSLVAQYFFSDRRFFPFPSGSQVG